ncbi:MAG: hypothetical protein A3B68_01070 [Candidatus Melainabacteria bacterium RIFCSPHIGHO2_02_FULL_34_12]|nr:MAG: hypothetical protein A3B68_01070 [Candidatus Melainabacteria bacterium RIFCSPHIGHO2_02_FULL_34_12]
MIPRFFIPLKEINWQEKKASLSSPDQLHKISRVLRLRTDDQIVLLDGSGIAYNAQIISLLPRAVQCRLLSRRALNTEPDLKITIAQALLKGPKFDYSLQKNTEIGICEFIPLITERTVVKFEENEVGKDDDNRIVRYQRIVRDAAEQSERGIVPIVRNSLSIEELCKQNLSSYSLKLVCLERSQINGIKEVLNSVQDKIQKVLIVIGPEGGLSESESKLLTVNGFIPVSLGKRIFRAETVGMVISSILFFYFNELK